MLKKKTSRNCFSVRRLPCCHTPHRRVRVGLLTWHPPTEYRSFRRISRTASGWRKKKDWQSISFRRGTYRNSRSEEHTSELQSHSDLVCRLLLEKKKKKNNTYD